MNGLVCLLVFGLLAITALAALGLCRRLFSHELPRRMATLALLENPQQWETQCAALAAQLTWTDMVAVLQRCIASSGKTADCPLCGNCADVVGVLQNSSLVVFPFALSY